VARIELLDDVQMDGVQRYSKLDAARGRPAVLRVPRHARRRRRSRPALRGDRRRARRRPFEWATRPEERTRLWQARHDAYWAARRCARLRIWATDVCVPISRLAECVELETEADLEGSGLIAPIVGHVGDGNFHLSLPDRPERPGRDRERPRSSTSASSSARIAMDGTCTGEHGIGALVV
jgi:D-lactate dehydrogenase (cytochrome)